MAHTVPEPAPCLLAVDDDVECQTIHRCFQLPLSLTRSHQQAQMKIDVRHEIVRDKSFFFFADHQKFL
jgi:hypothetical protein